MCDDTCINFFWTILAKISHWFKVDRLSLNVKKTNLTLFKTGVNDINTWYLEAEEDFQVNNLPLPTWVLIKVPFLTYYTHFVYTEFTDQWMALSLWLGFLQTLARSGSRQRFLKKMCFV